MSCVIRRRFLRLACFCVLGVGIAIGAAHAQTTSAADDSTAQSNASSGQLKEVIVTAQRRRQNLQNVPVAVDVVGSSALADNHIDNTLQLQNLVPGFVQNQLALGSQVSLRGVGSDATEPASEQGVATYVDGAVIADSAASVMETLLGIDHIEVLKGPQGTLFGRNAVAGAINYVTLTPTQQFKSDALIDFGNYASKKATLDVSDGILPHLAVGIYGAITERNTYLDRIPSEPIDGPIGMGNSDNRQTTDGLRLKAVYTPVDALEVTGSAEVTNENINEAISFRQPFANATGFQLGNGGYPIVIKPWTIESDLADVDVGRHLNFILRERVHLGWADFVAISNYRHDHSFYDEDNDATDLNSGPLAAIGSADIKAWQRSQELQLLSPEGSRWQWIAGLFYINIVDGYSPLGQVLSPYVAPTAAQTQTFSAIRTDSYAGYVQVTVPLWVDNLNLTIGDRYTVDKKKWTAYERFVDDALTEVAPQTSFPDRYGKWSQSTPKITVDYKAGNTLVYGGYSRGYLAGTFNTVSVGINQEVNPETLDAFEIGTKSDLLGHRLRVNTAAFHYKFDNLQVYSFEPTGSGLGNQILLNAASATDYGAEFSVQALVTPALSVYANGTYTHATYQSFPYFLVYLPAPPSAATLGGLLPNAASVVDASGNSMERAPKWSSTVGGQYTFRLSNGSQIAARANWYYNSGYYWDASNTSRQSAYNELNASADYVFGDARWAVSVWGTNLTNTLVENMWYPIPTGVFTSDGPPRMFGISLRYTYD